MCVCIIDAFLPDDDDSLDIHLYFCYICKCMHIKANIYPSTIAHPILICHRHLRRRVFFRSTPPMPNLRMPVRHLEKGRRQHGHLVWRTLGFGDLGKMCGFVWKKKYISIYIYIYISTYVCMCVSVRVPVCMCTAMMTINRPWLVNRMTRQRSRKLVEYFESMRRDYILWTPNDELPQQPHEIAVLCMKLRCIRPPLSSRLKISWFHGFPPRMEGRSSEILEPV